MARVDDERLGTKGGGQRAEGKSKPANQTLPPLPFPPGHLATCRDRISTSTNTNPSLSTTQRLHPHPLQNQTLPSHPFTFSHLMSRIPVPNGGLQHSPGSPGMPSTPASEPRRKTNRRDEVSLSLLPCRAFLLPPSLHTYIISGAVAATCCDVGCKLH